jgi:phage tail tape-measure protein
MKYSVTIIAIGSLAMLAACGTTTKERTSGGAAAGAATGAGVGALAGPPGVVAGAVIGGGAGAVAGATTSPNQVNLGKPPWTNPDTRVPATSRTGRSTDVGNTGTSQNASVDRLNERSLQAAQQGRTYQ